MIATPLTRRLTRALLCATMLTAGMSVTLAYADGLSVASDPAGRRAGTRVGCRSGGTQGRAENDRGLGHLGLCREPPRCKWHYRHRLRRESQARRLYDIGCGAEHDVGQPVHVRPHTV